MGRQVGIDLGTSNTTVFLRDRIVMRAPTVVSIDRATHEVIVSGSGAKKCSEKRRARYWHCDRSRTA